MGLNLRPLGKKIVDVFSADTQEDQRKRMASGQARFYADQQRAAGNMRPATNPGAAFLGNTARLANTAKAGVGGLYGLGKVGAASVFGTDDSYKRTLAGVNRTLEQDLSPNSGLFNAGTVFDSVQDLQNITPAGVARKSVAGGVGVSGEVIPPGRGVSVAAQGLRVVPRIAAEGAALGAMGNAGDQYIRTGRVDPKEVVLSAAVGSAGAAVPPVVTAGAKQLPKVTRKIEDVGYSQSAQGRVNIAEQQVLRDFSDSLVGANKAQGRELSDLITRARAVGQKYGVDLTTGPARDRLDRANGILDTIGKQRQTFTQSGFIQLPTRPKVAKKASAARPPVDKTQVEPPAVTAPAVLPKVTAKTPTTKVKLNTDRLNLDAGYEGMKRLDKDTAAVIKRMSNDEVVRLAKSAGMDTKTYTVGQTKKKIAEQLNVRRDAVRLQNEAEAARLRGDLEGAANLLKQSAERGRTSRTQGTDLARQLQARRIVANELDTPPQKIFKLLDNAGVNPDTYAKRFSTVDFNNANEVTAAYRELVPAKAGEWIDALRYSSMLSSPLTHIVNSASNALNVGVLAPVEKTVRGVIDAAGGLFGHERQYAAGEGAAYASATVRNLRQAANEFVNVLRQKVDTQTGDIDKAALPLAVGGAKGAASTALQLPTRLLGASDKFFRSLASAGEEGALKARTKAGIKIRGNQNALREHEAAYRVYQQDLGEKGQGNFLETIDSVANAIQGLRTKHKVFSWLFPFVKTPTNILKQGIEYSPLGIANLVGNPDKVTALTRAAVGTATFGTAVAMLDAGDITWGEPIDPEQKAAFRAEGKQPYAIRIGGKWVSFAKLPPAVAFPFALVSGVDDAVKSKKMDENTADAIFEGVAKWGQFLSDQSYVKQIGDALKTVRGSSEDAVQAVANYPQQLVPFRALSGWLARMTDPQDRKINSDKGVIDSQVQSLMLQFPGLREKVDARQNPFTGQPLEAQHPALNSVNPFRVTSDKGYGDTTGYNMQQREMQGTMAPADQKAFRKEVVTQKNIEAQDKKQKTQFKRDAAGGSTQLASGKQYVKVGDKYKTFDNKADADMAVAKDKFKKSGDKLKAVGDTVLYKTKSGDIKSKPKVLYDWEQADAKNKLQMDRAYEAKDLKSWMGLAQKQYAALESKKGLYDPETEQDEIDKITLQQENLMQKAQNYSEKGLGSKGKKSVGSAFKYAVSPTAGGGASRPTITAKRVGRVKSTKGTAKRIARPKVTVKKSLA